MNGILPNGKQQFIDSNGNPLASGKVYYYIPSTTTFKNTWQDDAGTVLNTNPIQLDANGQCIAYGTGSYRQQVYDVNNNLIWDLQVDSPATYADIAAFASELPNSPGASLVGYNQNKTNSVGRTVESKLQDFVSVKDFGAKGDGVTDDTAAIQAALNFGASSTQDPESNSGDVTVFFPSGRYLVTALDVPFRVSIESNGGVLAPYSLSGSQTHLLQFHAFSKVTNLVIDMSYALNYQSAILCNENQRGYLYFLNVDIWRASVAYMFGDPSWATTPSDGTYGVFSVEITGGSTIWGLTSMITYGQNTVINLSNVQFFSYQAACPPTNPNYTAWNALLSNTFINYGSVVIIGDSYIGNFTGNAACMVSRIQPVSASADYSNKYGEYRISNTGCESGWLFYTTPASTYPAQDTTSSVFQATGLIGYITQGNTGNYIDLQGDCLQQFSITDSRMHGNTLGNTCYSLKAPVRIEPSTFPNTGGLDFYDSMKVVYQYGQGGFVAVNAVGSTQTFTSTPSVLVCPTNNYTCTSAYPWINITSGLITVPETMRDVTIEVSLYFTTGATTDSTSFVIYLNGSPIAPPKQSIGIAPNAVFKIAKLNPGDQLQIKVTTSVNRTADGSGDNNIYMSGTI